MSREQARRDAAFARGDIGVDGAAVEEARDEAEVEKGKAREQYLRGKAFLGREFLTWLLWKSEGGEPLLNFDKAPLTVLFAGKVLLRGIAGEVVELAARGAMAAYSVLVRQALSTGMLIHSARLQLRHGEKVYEVTLDAEHLDVRGAKLPELMSEEEDDRLRERLYLAEQLSNLIDALVQSFLEQRIGKGWSREVVPALKQWMEEGSGEPKRVRRSA